MPFENTPQSFDQFAVDTVHTALDDAQTQIIALNDTNTALTKEERQASVSVGVARKPFNDFFFDTKDGHPNLKPAQTKVPEADAEQFQFINLALVETEQRLLTMLELISDMKLNAEHFAFDFASDGRMAAKTAAENGLPGADSRFDALNDLFPQTGPTGGGGEDPQP